jgi:NTE family protein
VFEGARHLLQAVLADPLVNDIHTLASRHAAGDRRVPYIFVAPERQDTIDDIARDIYVEHYPGRNPLRSSVCPLGGMLCSDDSPANAELLSYVLFASEFAEALIDQAPADARAWLRASHDDGLWQHEPLLAATVPAAGANARGRSRRSW